MADVTLHREHLIDPRAGSEYFLTRVHGGKIVTRVLPDSMRIFHSVAENSSLRLSQKFKNRKFFASNKSSPSLCLCLHSPALHLEVEPIGFFSLNALTDRFSYVVPPVPLRLPAVAHLLVKPAQPPRWRARGADRRTAVFSTLEAGVPGEVL